MYIGVTSDLLKRMFQHKNKLIDGFSRRYNLTKLVYFEETNDVNAALAREKQLKKYKRKKKIDLIKSVNPKFEDLSKDWFDNKKE